jgi:hypothetical protein
MTGSGREMDRSRSCMRGGRLDKPVSDNPLQPKNLAGKLDSINI